MNERLRGTIVSSNPRNKHGVIQGEDGTQYFYFEKDTQAFDFAHCFGVFVTFNAVPSKSKIAGLSLLALNIERDLVTKDFRAKQREERRAELLPVGAAGKEAWLKKRYGANYRAPSERYPDWATKSSTVLVAGE